MAPEVAARRQAGRSDGDPQPLCGMCLYCFIL